MNQPIRTVSVASFEKAVCRVLDTQGPLRRTAFWLGPPLLAIFVFIAFILIAKRYTDLLVLPDQDTEQVQGLELKTLVRQVKKGAAGCGF